MSKSDPVIDREVAGGPRKTFDNARADTLQQLETAARLTRNYQPIDPHFGDVGIMMALGENFAQVTEIANRSNSDGRLIDARNSIRPTRDAAEGARDTATERELRELFSMEEADAMPSVIPTCSGQWVQNGNNWQFHTGEELAVPAKVEIAPPKPAPDAVREAAKRLVDRLDYIHSHSAYKAVWEMVEMHTGGYRGPSYANDVCKLRAALSAPVPSPDGAMDALGWLLDAIKSEVPAALATPLLRRRFKDAEKVLLSPSATGTAEPVAWTPFRFVQIAFAQFKEPELRKIVDAISKNLPTLPPVRGDREAVARCIFKSRLKVGDQTADVYFTRRASHPHAIDDSTMAVDAAFRDADALIASDLSLPVQPSAGE